MSQNWRIQDEDEDKHKHNGKLTKRLVETLSSTHFIYDWSLLTYFLCKQNKKPWPLGFWLNLYLVCAWAILLSSYKLLTLICYQYNLIFSFSKRIPETGNLNIFIFNVVTLFNDKRCCSSNSFQETTYLIIWYVLNKVQYGKSYNQRF